MAPADLPPGEATAVVSREWCGRLYELFSGPPRPPPGTPWPLRDNWDLRLPRKDEEDEEVVVVEDEHRGREERPRGQKEYGRVPASGEGKFPILRTVPGRTEAGACEGGIPPLVVIL